MTMYKAKDAMALRDAVTIALQIALKDTLKSDLHFKVNSSNIAHTGLIPEGDVFTINFVVEVHKKEKAAVDVPT